MNHPLTHDALFAQMENTGDYAIRVENVSKRFALFNRSEDRLKQMLIPRLQRAAFMKPKAYFTEFSAVKDVTLTVKRGETIGIIGRNGSGKSTLLQMIVGTLQPTSGNVKVKGRIAALLELGAGFNPEFTGRENVYVNGAILGFSRDEMDERFEAIAAFAGIGAFIERPVKTYSSGMFVRLAFAVATAVEPDILIVDEALSVGDEAFQRKCFARIEAIKERGGTILFVSHGAQTIVQLCDRAVLLEAGEKILEGDPKAVVGQYQRLVNASDTGAQTIRREIANMAGIAHAVEDTASAASVVIEQNDFEDDVSEELYDTNLVSQSAVTLESRGALISNVKMTTLQGKPVNILRRSKRYMFQYQVTFTQDAQNVGFGMWIRTVNGIGLAGALTANSKEFQLRSVSAGDSIWVQYTSTYGLLRGNYFISCGVIGSVPGHDGVLHRITDAIAFKVLPGTSTISIGMFDLKPEFSIERR